MIINKNIVFVKMQNQSTTAYQQSLKGTETTNFQVSQPSNQQPKNITDLYKQDSISSNEHINININQTINSKIDQYNLLNSQQHEDLQHKEIRVFMKKAQKLNEVSYRKLHQGKVLMPEPSMLNIYKSSKNIFDDIVIPVNRDKQIRSIYLQGAHKNQKKSISNPKKTKSLLKRKLTTDSKLVQTDTLNMQTNQTVNQFSSQRPANRTLEAKPKLKRTLKAIEEDQDQQFIPVKRKTLNNRMFNTISLNGDIVRNKVDTNMYLNNVAKAEHQFNKTVRRYSVKEQFQQSTVFNSTSNGFHSGSFLQPIVNQTAVNHWESATIQKIKPKEDQSLPIIKQKSSLQQQTKKYTQQNNKETQPSRVLKSNSKKKQVTQNSMFVENDNSFRKSRKGTQAEFTIMRNTFSNNLNSDLKQQSSYYDTKPQLKDPRSHPKKVQTSIQVPQIHQIAIGTDTNNFIKTGKKQIHPINISFTEDESSWILTDYKPKSSYIRSIDTKNFLIKKYRNGVYFGELNQNGMKNGSGVVFYFNGRSYQGGFIDDVKSGKGFQYMPDGSVFKGDFKDGVKNGRGTFQWANGEVYDGQWAGGKRNGSGMWKSPRGDGYLGEWKNGKIQGFGVLTIKEGDRYEGQFKNSMKNGLGTQRYSNGNTYVGQFAKNRPNGQGEYYYNNGDFYRGMFSNGLKHGQGYFKTSNGQIYQGQFRNEKKCGLGEQINPDGSKYKGNFQNNMKHGYGQQIKDDGEIRKGYWINDNMVDTDMDPIIEDELDRQQSIANMKAKGKKQGDQTGRKTQLKIKPQKKRSPSNRSPNFSKQKSLSPSDPNFNRACGCKRKH